VIGSFASFERLEGDVPRGAPPSFTAGGRRALVEREEWHTIPNAGAATNALLTGEEDWNVSES